MENLQPDSYYRIELRAHNAIGASPPAHLLLKTARGESPSSLNTLLYKAGIESSNAPSTVVSKRISLLLYFCSIFVFVRGFYVR